METQCPQITNSNSNKSNSPKQLPAKVKPRNIQETSVKTSIDTHDSHNDDLTSKIESGIAVVSKLLRRNAGKVSALQSCVGNFAKPNDNNGSSQELLNDEVKESVDVQSNDNFRISLESEKRLNYELQIEMLKGRLTRRNEIIEVLRRAYYHDILIIKEELRRSTTGSTNSPSLSTLVNTKVLTRKTSTSLSSIESTINQNQNTSNLKMSDKDCRLSSIPSIDFREVLPLFSPSGTFLKVHPCESCGGSLELIHGETKELKAARKDAARAKESEEKTRMAIEQLRTNFKKLRAEHDALEQSFNTLTIENASTKESLKETRNTVLDQKSAITQLKSNLEEFKGIKMEFEILSAAHTTLQQELKNVVCDRDLFEASNIHLKQELGLITEKFDILNIERAQINTDYQRAAHAYQEELKKSEELSVQSMINQKLLEESNNVIDEKTSKINLLHDELTVATNKFEQMKRLLEERLRDQEHELEESQSQNFTLRKVNKQLAKDKEKLENAKQQVEGQLIETNKKINALVNLQKDLDNERLSSAKTKVQLEESIMRLEDLVGLLMRQEELDDSKEVDFFEMMKSNTQLRRSSMYAIKYSQNHSPSFGDENTTQRRLSQPNVVSIELGMIGNVQSRNSRAEQMSLNSKPKLASRNSRQLKVGLAGVPVVGSVSKLSATTESCESSSVEDPEQTTRAAAEIDAFNHFEHYHTIISNLEGGIQNHLNQISKLEQHNRDLEKKYQVMVEKHDEANLTIDSLRRMSNALKDRLNQDSAGAADHIERIVKQVEDTRRDHKFEVDKFTIIANFVRRISSEVFDMCKNKSLLADILPGKAPSIELEVSESMNYTNKHVNSDQKRKKAEMKRAGMIDRILKQFEADCKSRGETIVLEIHKLLGQVNNMQEDLDSSSQKIDEHLRHIHELDNEVNKLLSICEATSKKLETLESTLRETSKTAEQYKKSNIQHMDELAELQKKNMEMEKNYELLYSALQDKTYEYEIEVSEKKKVENHLRWVENTQAKLEIEHSSVLDKLQSIEKAKEHLRLTNCNVGILACPEIVEAGIQTEIWKPKGLILRQRNAPDAMPQRYQGTSTVRIACPELQQLALASLGATSSVPSFTSSILTLSQRPVTVPLQKDTAIKSKILKHHTPRFLNKMSPCDDERNGGRQFTEGNAPRCFIKLNSYTPLPPKNDLQDTMDNRNEALINQNQRSKLFLASDKILQDISKS